MNRLLLLLLAVGISAAYRSSPYTSYYYPYNYPYDYNGPSSLLTDTDYVYEYESQVLTGVPQLEEQYSGLKIKCSVRTQTTSNGIVIKLENIRILEMNDLIRSLTPSEILPTEIFKNIPDTQAKPMIDKLLIPITFRYDTGYVSEIKVAEEDVHWSINIKKAIINLFQVNLGKRGQDFYAHHRPDIYSYDTHSAKSNPITDTFKVMEPGVAGECESLYTVIGKDQEIYVTKVRDYNKCVEKPIYVQGLFAGLGSGVHAPLNKRPLVKTTSHTDYVLTGSPENFLIKYAELNSRLLYQPFNEESGSIATYIVQKLSLKTSVSKSMPLLPYTSLVPLREGLLMTIPNPITTEIYSKHYKIRSPHTDLVSIAERILDEIVSETKVTLDTTTPMTVARLVMILRDCSEEQLRTIINKEISRKSIKRTILLDVLPTLTTPEVVPVLVDIIKSGHVNVIRANYIITMISLIVPPSPKAITSLIPLVEDPNMMSKPLIFRPVVFAIGTLTHKLYRISEKMPRIKPEIRSTIITVTKTFETLYENSRTDVDRVVILKAIGNCGLPEILPKLETIIYNKELPIKVRTQAVYALRRIAPIAKYKVQNICMPTYMDLTKPDDVRIACFVMIMKTHPCFATLQTVGHILRHERSLQVGSFVYSYLRTLATARSPNLRMLSESVRTVLLSAKPILPGMFYSKGIYMDAFVESLDMGSALDLFMLQSPGSGIPKSIIAKLNVTVAGHTINLFETGFETEGMDTLIRRLMGPYGIVSEIYEKKKSFMDLFSEPYIPHWGKLHTEITNIFKDMPFSERTSLNPTTSMYIKLLGNTIGYYDVKTLFSLSSELDIFREIESLLTSGKKIDTLNILPLVDSTLILPTPIGLPLNLNTSMITLLRLKGDIRIEGMPSISDIIKGRFYPKNLKAYIDILPIFSTEMLMSMGIDMTLIHTGVTTVVKNKLTMPIKGDMSLDIDSGTYSHRINIPTNKYEIMYTEIKPKTYTVIIPTVLSSERVNIISKEIVNNTIVTPTNIKFMRALPMLEGGVVFDGLWSRSLPLWAPTNPYNGPHVVRLTWEPTPKTPRVMETEITFNRDTPSSIYGYKESESSEEDDSCYFCWMWNKKASKKNYRTYPRETLDFLPVEVDPVIKSPIKYRILMITRPKVGGSPDKTHNMQFIGITSPDYLSVQWNIQKTGVSSWLYFSDSASLYTKWILEGVHDIRKIIFAERHPSSKEFVSRFIFGFGEDTAMDHHVVLKTFTARETDFHFNMYPSVVPTFKTTLPVYRYITTLEYDVERSEMTTVRTVLLDLLRAYVPLIPVKLELPSERNKLIIMSECSSALEMAHLYIKTPLSVDYVLSMPTRMPFIKPTKMSTEPALYRQSFPHILSSHRKVLPKTWMSTMSGECTINEKEIETMDTYKYRLPELPAECEVVLSQDCSKQHVYTILAKLPVEPSRRTIKLLIPDIKVEVPLTWIPNVIISGREERVRDVITVPKDEVDRKKILVEIKKESNRIIVHAKKIDLTLITDGKEVSIVLPTYLRNRTCGLCGDFDNELSKELRGPKFTSHRLPEMFVSEYIVPSPTCNKEEVSSKYENPVQTHHRYSESCKPKLVTYVERDTSDDEICMSTVPIYMCKGRCETHSSEKVYEKVPLHCMPISHESREMKRVAETGEIVHDLLTKVISYEKSVPIPKICKPW